LKDHQAGLKTQQFCPVRCDAVSCDREKSHGETFCHHQQGKLASSTSQMETTSSFLQTLTSVCQTTHHYTSQKKKVLRVTEARTSNLLKLDTNSTQLPPT